MIFKHFFFRFDIQPIVLTIVFKNVSLYVQIILIKFSYQINLLIIISYTCYNFCFCYIASKCCAQCCSFNYRRYMCYIAFVLIFIAVLDKTSDHRFVWARIKKEDNTWSEKFFQMNSIRNAESRLFKSQHRINTDTFED